jgi:hypothetical protein
MEVIGVLIIVVIVFAGVAGSPEGVLPMMCLSLLMFGLVSIIGKITGLDMKMLGGIGFVGWVYLVYLFRKADKKSRDENRN